MTTTRYPGWRNTISVSLLDAKHLAIMESQNSKESELAIRDMRDGECMSLGPATKQNIEALQSYLERLKIHCNG